MPKNAKVSTNIKRKINSQIISFKANFTILHFDISI